MSADLNTIIEMEGTLEEIMAMITVIKGYCGHKQDVSLDFPRICLREKFDGKNDVLLETLSEEALTVFLAERRKKVFVAAGGRMVIMVALMKPVYLKQSPRRLQMQNSRLTQPVLLRVNVMILTES